MVQPFSHSNYAVNMGRGGSNWPPPHLSSRSHGRGGSVWPPPLTFLSIDRGSWNFDTCLSDIKTLQKIFFDNFPTPMTAFITWKLLFYDLFLRQFSFPNDRMAGGGSIWPPPSNFFSSSPIVMKFFFKFREWKKLFKKYFLIFFRPLWRHIWRNNVFFQRKISRFFKFFIFNFSKRKNSGGMSYRKL